MRIAAIIPVVAILSGLARTAFAQKDKVYELMSPEGVTKVSVTVGSRGLTWALSHNGQSVLEPSAVALQVAGGETPDGGNTTLKNP